MLDLVRGKPAGDFSGIEGFEVFSGVVQPHSPDLGRLLFAPDLVGSSEELAEGLRAHAAFREVGEVAFALLFTLEHDDHVQILTDMATKPGPGLGWRPVG